MSMRSLTYNVIFAVSFTLALFTIHDALVTLGEVL